MHASIPCKKDTSLPGGAAGGHFADRSTYVRCCSRDQRALIKYSVLLLRMHSPRDLLEPLEYLPGAGSQRRRRAAARRGQLEERAQAPLLPRPTPALPSKARRAERVGDLALEDQVLEGGRGGREEEDAVAAAGLSSRCSP